MNASVSSSSRKSAKGKAASVPMETLYAIVKGFRPEEIGLARAWDEFYYACQAAAAKPELLAAIHEIKESIEDAEAGHA